MGFPQKDISRWTGGLLLFPVMLSSCLSPGDLPSLEATLGQAEATSAGDHLVVSTGEVQRTWEWNGRGLATVSFQHLNTGREWCSGASLAPRTLLMINARDQENRPADNRLTERESFTKRVYSEKGAGGNLEIGLQVNREDMEDLFLKWIDRSIRE